MGTGMTLACASDLSGALRDRIATQSRGRHPGQELCFGAATGHGGPCPYRRDGRGGPCPYRGDGRGGPCAL